MIQDNYIVLDMVQVSQLQSGIVFTGKIKFSELNLVYKLTERQESINDPFGTRINFDKKDVEFQRQLSQSKLKSIVTYLKTELEKKKIGKSLAMFPSSLILYNRSYEADDLVMDANVDEVPITEQIITNSYSEQLDCCFYVKSDDERSDLFKVYIPKNKDITLIVDGQHRFVGTQKFYETLTSNEKEEVNDFEFIVTYLVGFDLFEVGEIFATVNFNQKPVNRSLYYDIFGSAPQTDRDGKLQNDIRLAHDLALHLNNNDKSPIRGMIKLLGKGYGLFSQAFFVDKMRRYVFNTKVWDGLILDYINGGKEYTVIATFMRSYFEALKSTYPNAWPKTVRKNNEEVYSSYSYEYILCKTTGLGAYFRLIKYIYPMVQSNPENFKQSIEKIFKKISQVDAESLFHKRGEFGGAGSEGLQDRLFKVLLEKYDLY